MPRIAILSVIALLALPANALLQSWEEQVEIQIAAIHAEIAADYDYASDLVIGELEHDDVDGFTLRLRGDAEYIIVGVCDNDCADLDLAIYDPYEDEVAADTEYDDYPVLYVSGEGDYEVEVYMADCAAATCLWGAQVFVLE